MSLSPSLLDLLGCKRCLIVSSLRVFDLPAACYFSVALAARCFLPSTSERIGGKWHLKDKKNCSGAVVCSNECVYVFVIVIHHAIPTHFTFEIWTLFELIAGCTRQVMQYKLLDLSAGKLRHVSYFPSLGGNWNRTWPLHVRDVRSAQFATLKSPSGFVRHRTSRTAGTASFRNYVSKLISILPPLPSLQSVQNKQGFFPSLQLLSRKSHPRWPDSFVRQNARSTPILT